WPPPLAVDIRMLPSRHPPVSRFHQSGIGLDCEIRSMVASSPVSEWTLSAGAPKGSGGPNEPMITKSPASSLQAKVLSWLLTPAWHWSQERLIPGFLYCARAGAAERRRAAVSAADTGSHRFMIGPSFPWVRFQSLGHNPGLANQRRRSESPGEA